MKTNLCSLAAVALCTGFLASCASEPIITKVPMSASSSAASSDKSLSARLLNEVNAYRASKGAKALVRNPGLDRMAQEHSEFLRQNRGKFTLGGTNVSHLGFESRSLKARELFSMPTIGENVAAMHSSSTTELVQAWARSSGHNFIMKADWEQTGIGLIVDTDGTLFATQIFGTPSNSQMEFNDRLRSF